MNTDLITIRHMLTNMSTIEYDAMNKMESILTICNKNKEKILEAILKFIGLTTNKHGMTCYDENECQFMICSIKYVAIIYIKYFNYRKNSNLLYIMRDVIMKVNSNKKVSFYIANGNMFFNLQIYLKKIYSERKNLIQKADTFEKIISEFNCNKLPDIISELSSQIYEKNIFLNENINHIFDTFNEMVNTNDSKESLVLCVKSRLDMNKLYIDEINEQIIQLYEYIKQLKLDVEKYNKMFEDNIIFKSMYSNNNEEINNLICMLNANALLLFTIKDYDENPELMSFYENETNIRRDITKKKNNATYFIKINCIIDKFKLEFEKNKIDKKSMKIYDSFIYKLNKNKELLQILYDDLYLDYDQFVLRYKSFISIYTLTGYVYSKERYKKFNYHYPQYIPISTETDATELTSKTLILEASGGSKYKSTKGAISNNNDIEYINQRKQPQRETDKKKKKKKQNKKKKVK